MSTGAVLFALMGFFARVASAHVPWTLVACTRALLGAAVAFGVGRVRGVAVWPKSTPAMWARSGFGTVAMLCTFYAVGSRALALGDASTLVNLAPVMLAVLAPLVLGERAGRRVFLALPIALTGVILILRPPILFGGMHAASSAMLLAAGVAVLGSFSTSCAMMMLRRVGKTETPEAIATHFSLVAAATCAVLSLGVRVVPPWSDAMAMITAGVCAGLAQLAMTRAYSLELAARVSPFGYLTVVASALLGAVGLHEWPSPLALLGMALVVTSGIVVTVAGALSSGPHGSEAPVR